MFKLLQKKTAKYEVGLWIKYLDVKMRIARISCRWHKRETYICLDDSPGCGGFSMGVEYMDKIDNLQRLDFDESDLEYITLAEEK